MENVNELSALSGIPSESFADAIFNRYARRLMHVAGERLGAKLRSKVSPEDIVQSAFKSFFRRQREFHFENDGADGLWGLLVVITVRKCAKWADAYGAAKRDARMEISLQGTPVDGQQWRELVSREPGPEEALLLTELVEGLMGRLDGRQREIVALRMQGFEVNEIADQVRASQRTVARVTAQAKELLRGLLAAGE